MEKIYLPKTWESEYNQDDDSANIKIEDSDKMEQTFAVMQWNINEVVISVLGLERKAKQIVLSSFECKERELFSLVILESDFFSFSSMIKTLKQIQVHKKIFDTKAWKSLEENLKRVMRYRNLLVHGQQKAFKRGEEILIRVSYFEGEPKTMEFDKSRWEKVEKAIRDSNIALGRFNSIVFSFGK